MGEETKIDQNITGLEEYIGHTLTFVTTTGWIGGEIAALTLVGVKIKVLKEGKNIEAENSEPRSYARRPSRFIPWSAIQSVELVKWP